jgi:hypothetical protein
VKLRMMRLLLQMKVKVRKKMRTLKLMKKKLRTSYMVKLTQIL